MAGLEVIGFWRGADGCRKGAIVMSEHPEATGAPTPLTRRDLSRRDLIKRGLVVAGALAWALPAIESFAPAAWAQDKCVQSDGCTGKGKTVEGKGAAAEEEAARKKAAEEAYTKAQAVRKTCLKEGTCENEDEDEKCKCHAVGTEPDRAALAKQASCTARAGSFICTVSVNVMCECR
jgi:hypothetical protein